MEATAALFAENLIQPGRCFLPVHGRMPPKQSASGQAELRSHAVNRRMVQIIEHLQIEKIQPRVADEFLGLSYRRGVRWLKNAGITSVGSFLIGFPGETAETIAQTEEFISDAGLDFFYLQMFYYLHHAPIHRVASKFGLTGRGLLWSHATMDWQEASARLDQIFRKQGSRCLHQDYNLWEIAFLENRGFDRDRIIQYRSMINRMALAKLDSMPDAGKSAE